MYLPNGGWYNVYTDEKINGEKELTEDVPIYQLPLYIKASSVIPLQSIVQSTKEKPSDTLELHIYNGGEESGFIYYEDEGDGFGYKNKGYCKKQILFSPKEKKLTIEKQEGSFVSRFTKLLLVFHGFDSSMNKVQVNGIDANVSKTNEALLLDALSNLGDIYDKDYYTILKNGMKKNVQLQTAINNSTSEIIIKW